MHIPPHHCHRWRERAPSSFYLRDMPTVGDGGAVCVVQLTVSGLVMSLAAVSVWAMEPLTEVGCGALMLAFVWAAYRIGRPKHEREDVRAYGD